MSGWLMCAGFIRAEGAQVWARETSQGTEEARSNFPGCGKQSYFLILNFDELFLGGSQSGENSRSPDERKNVEGKTSLITDEPYIWSCSLTYGIRVHLLIGLMFFLVRKQRWLKLQLKWDLPKLPRSMATIQNRRLAFVLVLQVLLL